MQKNRLFIAINLSNDVKEELARFKNDLPAKWVLPDNLHITLSFIGDVIEGKVFEIKNIVSTIVNRFSCFEVRLKKVCYDSEVPRMIWVVGEDSPEFEKLKKDIEKELGLKVENKTIIHITLARIKQWQWKMIEPEERPEINENIDISFKVCSIELMESKLKRTGSEYNIIESYKLK